MLKTFIKRPITAIAINLVMLVVGFTTLAQLEMRHKPTVLQNELQIITAYPGASAEVVEQRVTKPIEEALAGIDGVRKLVSESKDGSSDIFIRLKADVNYSQVMSQVRDKIFGVYPYLPDKIKRPLVMENAESNPPILYISVQDKSKTIAQITDYLQRILIGKLQLIEGIAEVSLFGENNYYLKVEIDPAKLVEQEITINQVAQVVGDYKTFASGGEIENDNLRKPVLITAKGDSIEQFASIPIKTLSNGNVVALKDLGQVSLDVEKPNLIVRVDGKEIIGIQIKAKPNANPLTVAARVKSFVKELQATLSPSMQVGVLFDTTEPFKYSLNNIKKTMWEAIILVGIIIVWSLQSKIAAFLAMITVPLCIIGTFTLIFLLNFTLNPATLLALVLAVGLVVDDAIVIIENISHQMQKHGYSAFKAALYSSKEISFAVLVMTLTLAAVYLPLAFQHNETAILFKEFAYTLAGAVLISGVVALTLTPALCGQFLTVVPTGKLWQTWQSKYRYYLSYCLAHPAKLATVSSALLLLAIFLFLKLPKELLPKEDENYIWGPIVTESAITNKVWDNWLGQIEGVIAKEVPERIDVFTGRHRGGGWWGIRLKNWDERSRDAKEITVGLKARLQQEVYGPFTDAIESMQSSSDDNLLKVIIQYYADYEEVLKLTKKVIKALEVSQLFPRVWSEQTKETARVVVQIDTKLANQLGINITKVENSLYTLLAGRKTENFNFRGFDYNIHLKALDTKRTDLNNINSFFVQNDNNVSIPIGSLVHLSEKKQPLSIKHYDRIRGAAIYITPSEKLDFDASMKLISKIVQENLPLDAKFKFSGKAEKYLEARKSLLFTFGLSLLFIYLILAALFESFIHPLVVLLTVPLSASGAFIALYLSNSSNDSYVLIGLITLIGLISKHGILIVDFSNKLIHQGIELQEAITSAALERLRPITMTTLAMIAGAIPLLITKGGDAIARKHIGWVIIGGMVSGTLLSLFVIPTVHFFITTYIKSFKRKRAHALTV